MGATLAGFGALDGGELLSGVDAVHVGGEAATRSYYLFVDIILPIRIVLSTLVLWVLQLMLDNLLLDTVVVITTHQDNLLLKVLILLLIHSRYIELLHITRWWVALFNSGDAFCFVFV